jgi:hypothetical protein
VLKRSSFRGQRLKDSLEIMRSHSAQLVSLSQWLADVYNELKTLEDSEMPQNVAAVKLLVKQHKVLPPFFFIFFYFDQSPRLPQDTDVSLTNSVILF